MVQEQTVLRKKRSADASLIRSLVGQKSSNGVVYFAGVRVEPEQDSAATLFAALNSPDMKPLRIIVTWPAYFQDPNAWESANRRYPDAALGLGIGSQNHRAEFPISTRPVPAQCADIEQQYLKSAFNKALLSLEFVERQKEFIEFQLTAEVPRALGAGIWEVNFHVSGEPRIHASNEHFYFVDVPASRPKKTEP
jgi:hypothetical protein